MITFMVLYWLIGLIQNIFEFIFHPLRTIGNSSIFKMILYFYAFMFWLAIVCLAAFVYICAVAFLLLFDLIKWILDNKNRYIKGDIK